MDRERALREIKDLQRSSDLEVAHSMADQVLCDLLRDLGYQDVITEYSKIAKWFA